MTTNVNPGGSGGVGPLAGVRVLDFSVYAALILKDYPSGYDTSAE